MGLIKTFSVSVLTRLVWCAFSLSSSGKKREGDLAAALSRASTLETQLNKSEAALTTALSQNASLTSELMEVKGQLAKVCIAGPLCLALGRSHACHKEVDCDYSS